MNCYISQLFGDAPNFLQNKKPAHQTTADFEASEESPSKSQLYVMLNLLLENMAPDSGGSTADGEDLLNDKLLNESSTDDISLKNSSILDSLFDDNNSTDNFIDKQTDCSEDFSRITKLYSEHFTPLEKLGSFENISPLSNPAVFPNGFFTDRGQFLSKNAQNILHKSSHTTLDSIESAELSNLADSNSNWATPSAQTGPALLSHESFNDYNDTLGHRAISAQTQRKHQLVTDFLPIERSQIDNSDNLETAALKLQRNKLNVDFKQESSFFFKPQLLPMHSSDSTTTFHSSSGSNTSIDDSKGLKIFLNDGTAFAQNYQPSQNFSRVYKVFPCPNAHQVHNKNNCIYYHSQKDKRRHPIFYKAEQCDFHFDLKEETACLCPEQDNCRKCHNRHELLYHPTIYKKRFCASYNSGKPSCIRGMLCAFAHKKEEMLRPLITIDSKREFNSDFFMTQFKTLWCPYGSPHNWHNCFYAHTYQDYRRSPKIGYNSKPCPQWKKDLHSADYNKRCPLGTRCPYSHGSKEQLYHPQYYKIMPCIDYFKQGFCPREVFCSFYHNINEKRQFDVNMAVFDLDVSFSIKCLDAKNMSHLQKDFYPPPPFNLDDFVSFGNPKAI